MPEPVTQEQVAFMADRWWPPELHNCLHYLVQCSTVSQHHVRLPTALLESVHHGANAITVLAWLDNHSTDGISHVRRASGLQELGLTPRQWEQATQQLLGVSTTRKAKETQRVETAAFMRFRHRGARRAARREILPAKPYVALPPRSLQHLQPEADPRISAKSFRLLAAVHNNAVKNPLAAGIPVLGWCELSTSRLAQGAALSATSLRKWADELVNARLVVRHEKPGEATILLPIAVSPAGGVYETCVQALADVVDARAGRTVLRPITNPTEYAGELGRKYA